MRQKGFFSYGLKHDAYGAHPPAIHRLMVLVSKSRIWRRRNDAGCSNGSMLPLECARLDSSPARMWVFARSSVPQRALLRQAQKPLCMLSTATGGGLSAHCDQPPAACRGRRSVLLIVRAVHVAMGKFVFSGIAHFDDVDREVERLSGQRVVAVDGDRVAFDFRNRDHLDSG